MGCPVRRHALILPAVGVPLESAADIERQARVEFPRVADPPAVVHHVVHGSCVAVIQLHLVGEAVGIPVENVKGLILEEAAAIALPVVAALEVVAARPAVLEIRERGIELGL